jgi:asparagine synthase (glutamine-hydrolysing)
VTFQPFADAEAATARLQAMNRAIAHRGPDAEGYWTDPEWGVALGHRRLSIIDLSPAGAQPMVSACGRYMLAYNGEIYNHASLRRELEDACTALAWRGHSDTETLLAAIAKWGLERALHKAAGMFALALWDRRDGVLSLARDRMGEKPLYLSRRDGAWLFGSELRALLAGGQRRVIDRAALAAYLRLGYVPDHLCILESVYKVMPGGILRLRKEAEPEQLQYDSVEARFGQTPEITDRDKALSRLDQVLTEVVGDQMLSDVPLGCFLSGGVDSSLVASLMQATSPGAVRSFSIGFDNPDFNEAPHAAAVARHLGMEHTEFTLKEEEALAIVADLPRIYDEPFADSSQIPTVLLCRAARQHVTVALSGDGGDEVFGGYNRHIRGPGLWDRISRLPWPLRQASAQAVDGMVRLGLRNARASRKVISTLGLPLTTLQNLPKLSATLRAAGDPEDFYQTFVSVGPDPDEILAETLPSIPTNLRALSPKRLDMAEWIMARDVTGYLPGDILVKVDRAAMSVGLETRAPFLDSRVETLARQIPLAMHLDGREGKKLLRALLYRHVPRELIERPKQGFAVPLDDWLRSALHGWASDLLNDHQMITTLGLNTRFIRQLWVGHQKRSVNAGRELWIILTLLQWARENNTLEIA